MRKHIVAYIVLLIFVVGTSILCWLRWDAWFRLAPEPSFTLPDTPTRILVTPGEKGLQERNINWVSGSSQSYTLDYRYDKDSLWHACAISMQEVKTHGGTTYLYHSSIPLLTKRVIYRISDKEQRCVFHLDTLLSPSLQEDTFVYIGDIQDTHEGDTPALFSKISQSYPGTTAWIFAGDAIERGYNKYWDLWYHSIQSFCTRIPLLVVTGNHEHNKALPRKLDPRWIQTFHYPSNSECMRGTNYFVDFAHCRVVCINSEGLDRPSRIFETGKWLKSVLSSYNDGFKIVVFHHAVYPIRKGRFHPIMYAFFRPILENPRYHVSVILQGHDHAYGRRLSHSSSGSATAPVYYISTTSDKRYLNSFSPQFDKLGSGRKWYQIITTSSDSLVVSSYLDTGELYDKVAIHRSKDNTLLIHDEGRSIPEEHALTFGTTRKEKKRSEAYEKAKTKRLLFLSDREKTARSK